MAPPIAIALSIIEEGLERQEKACPSQKRTWLNKPKLMESDLGLHQTGGRKDIECSVNAIC